MDENQYHQSTPRYIFTRYAGWQHTQNEVYRNQWEQTRLTSFYAIAPHLEKGATIKKFMPLPWDAPPKSKLTEAEKQILNRLFPAKKQDYNTKKL
jgi:hypothetical protein